MPNVALDEYERQARFVPGLVAFLPVAIAVVALGLKENPVISLVGRQQRSALLAFFRTHRR